MQKAIIELSLAYSAITSPSIGRSRVTHVIRKIKTHSRNISTLYMGTEMRLVILTCTSPQHVHMGKQQICGKIIISPIESLLRMTSMTPFEGDISMCFSVVSLSVQQYNTSTDYDIIYVDIMSPPS